jgi:hypothetical protein
MKWLSDTSNRGKFIQIVLKKVEGNFACGY